MSSSDWHPPLGVQTRTTLVDDEGRYSLEMTVEAVRHDPVDGSMEAYTPEGKKVELKGRRFVMGDDQIIEVQDGRNSAPVASRKPPVRYIPSTSFEQAMIS